MGRHAFGVAFSDNDPLAKHHKAVHVPGLDRPADGRRGAVSVLELDIVKPHRLVLQWLRRPVAAPDIPGGQHAAHVAKGPAVEWPFLHVGKNDLFARSRRKGPHQFQGFIHDRRTPGQQTISPCSRRDPGATGQGAHYPVEPLPPGSDAAGHT